VTGRRAISLLIAVVGIAAWALTPARGATLGTVSLNANVPNTCPAGFSCQGVTVSACPGVANVGGFYAVKDPVGVPTGTVVFFSGSAGKTWWSDGGAAWLAMLDTLVNENYRVVQVRWSQGWQVAQTGQQTGLAALACRPATMVKYVHDNLYSGSAPDTGRCGFCVTGQSNGGSQATYALAFYGLDPMVDGLFPTSGPTYASLDKGCRGDAGYDYAGAVGGAISVDQSYGFGGGGTGPCSTHDLSFLSKWTADGIVTGGNDYAWPTTRVHVIEGTADPYFNHATDFRDKLLGVGQALTFQEIVGMEHQLNAAGLQALHDAIVGGGGPPPTTTTTSGVTTTTVGTTTTTTIGTTTTTRASKTTTTTGGGTTTTVVGGTTTTRVSKTTTTHL
jgi:hypothetical protein